MPNPSPPAPLPQGARGEKKPIVVPEFGAPRAIVSVWYVKPGETVFAGDRVVELLVGSATLDVNTEVGGVFIAPTAWPDDAVTPGQIVGHVEATGD